MGEAESWNISRAEFRKLAAEYPDFPTIRDRLSSGAYIWQPLSGDRAAREDFNVAATRAALIGGVPPSVDPVFHWQEVLSRSGAAVETSVADVYVGQDGQPLPAPLRWWGIEIPRVLAASAEYCADQEQLALQATSRPQSKEGAGSDTTQRPAASLSIPEHCSDGIAAVRTEAERELRAFLTQFNAETPHANVLPGFKTFAARLFDGGATACCGEIASWSRASAERFLCEDLIAEVIAQMEPARALAEAKGEYRRPEDLAIISRPDEPPRAHDRVGNDLGPDEQRYASIIFAPHGDIEFFLAEAGLPFKLFPHEMSAMTEAIHGHLSRQVFQ